MRIDFTPRLFFAPQSAEEAAALNTQMERLVQLYQKVDGFSFSQAQQMANASKQAGTLTKEIEKLEKELHDTVFASDYLYRSFQEQTAELKNQNNILKIGRSLFNALTDTAQKLTSFQKGYGDLREKDFKKLQNSLSFQVDNNKKIIEDLKIAEKNRKREIDYLKDIKNTEEGLNKAQAKRLESLQKEEELYQASLDAQKNSIPILQKELSLSQQIYKTREDLGGLTKAAAGVIQKYGGSLAQYLDVSEAIEAVDEYNKKVIDNALEQESVLTRLKQIEAEKLQLEKDVVDQYNLASELLSEIKNKQKELNDLKSLETAQQNLINLSLENDLSSLVQKKNLIQNVLGSLDLEQDKQDEILKKIDNQISLQKEIEQNDARVAEIRKEIADLNNDLEAGLINQQQHAERLNQLTEDRNRIEGGRLQLLLDISHASIEVNEVLRYGSELQTKINDKLSSQLSIEEEIKNLSNQQNFAKQEAQKKEAGLADALNKKEQEAYDIKQAAVKATSTGLTGFINKFKSLGVLIGNLNFTKVFTDPAVLLGTIVDLGFKANKQVVELGKSFGVSAKQAEDIRQSVAEFARGTGDTFINTDRLLKAQSELSKELGIAVRFSNEELSTFAKLTELTGLSAQEAGKLALASKAAGLPTEAYTDSLREAAFYAQQSTNTHFSSKEILQDVAKLSSGILVKFQGNPKAIAQAVVEAKKLGLTLDQLDKVGESLLNWESSIENELKAELLTGRELNLERARAAALSGDQLALTREISSQVGSLNDFQNMNVIAQKSLADAFGLSRDEMAEMLMKQEAINKFGNEAAKLNKEQLEDMKRQGLSASEYLKKQEQQRAAQDKFQDAMIKLQDIIGNLVAGPVGQLLDALANMVGFVMKIFGNPIVKGFLNIISLIAEKLSDLADTNFGKTILGLGAILLILPRIAGGLGTIIGSIGSIGKGLLSVFDSNKWRSFGEGLTSIWKKGKDAFFDYFKGLKDKFLESKSLASKAKEEIAGKVEESLVDKTKEAIEDKAKETIADKTKETIADKTKEVIGDKTKEVIEGKIEDKTEDLTKKITEKAEETSTKAEEVGKGGNGVGFKERMQNIAEGIKAFGNGKVILGGLVGLPASAVGLIAMIPGVLGIKLIEKVNGPKFQEAMYGIAYGIETFGNTKVTGGAANLILASLGLTAMIPGVGGAKLIEKINGIKFQESMTGLASGISAMGTLAVTGGVANLILASVGLIAMIPGVLGAKAIEQIKGEKFQENMYGLAYGIEAFGNTKVTGGAANLILASLGLISMLPGVLGAKAIEQINGTKFTEAMIGLSSGLSAMGNLAVTGGAANLILVSTGLISMLPGVLGAKAIEQINGTKFTESMTGLASGISAMGNIAITGGAANLILVSTGLIAMLPGIIGAKAVEQINGAKFTESMAGLASGLSTMGNLIVTKGSANLILASAGLLAMIPGVIGAKTIEQINGTKFTESMVGLTSGLSAMGILAATKGAANLILTSIGLVSMLPGVVGAKAIEQINGAKFNEAMVGLALGLSTMGNLTVTGGAANLILASLSLVSMIPGVLGAKAIEQINGAKFNEALIGLSLGISTMGSLTVTKGVTNLILASVGLVSMIPGVLGAKIIEQINGAKFNEAMIGLSSGLSAMGVLTVTGGAANLILASAGLIAMIPGTIGALAIQLINGTTLSKSLIGLATGLSAMGTPSAVIGALALIPAALGLTAMIAGVAGGALLGVAGPLIETGLISLAAGLSAFGLSAPGAIVGIGLLALFSAALIPLGYALNLASPAIEAFGKAIKSTFEGIGTIITAAANGIATMFNSLENVNVSKLLAIGPALISIGVGLASLGAGGILNAIGSFLGGDPIKKIEKLAETAPGLDKASSALQKLSGTLKELITIDISNLSSIGPTLKSIGLGLATLGIGEGIENIVSFLTGDPIEKLERLAATSDGLIKTATALQTIAGALGGLTVALNTIDTSKLESLDEFASNRATESITGGIADFITSPIKTISEVIGGGGKNETINTNIDLTPMVDAIKEVKASVDRLYSKETSIKMDGNKVGSTLVQGSYKVA